MDYGFEKVTQSVSTFANSERFIQMHSRFRTSSIEFAKRVYPFPFLDCPGDHYVLSLRAPTSSSFTTSILASESYYTEMA